MKDTPPTPPPKPSIHLNWKEWLPYVAHSDASDDEKRKAIEAIWSLAFAFVDLGWEIDDSPETSGQSLDLITALQAAVVYSESQQKEEV